MSNPSLHIATSYGEVTIVQRYCSNLASISGLQLADPDYSVSGSIQVIIGSDNYHVVIRPGMIPGDSSSPTAQQTIFGWVLCGPMSATETPVSAQAHHCSPDHELQDLLSRFWTQEELPKSTTAELTEEEEECERHFLTTYSRDATGRYVVRLPLKSNPSVLGESKAKALGCLKNLFQRFSNQSTFQQLYVNFLDEYLKMGHMTEVDASSDQTSVVHYLPHHGIEVHSDDWNLQRILWIGREQQLLAYCLTTVTYGLRCAPFLALRTLQQLIKEEGHRFPKAIIPMKKGRFVDNIYGGSDTTSEAREIIQQVTGLCKAGGFPLHEWSSNHPEFLPNSEEGGLTDIEIEPTTSCKLLGLVWRPCTDTLHFSSAVPGTITFTKRAIASDIAKLYDPLGLISPIMIRAKIILQELWLLKTGWDETISVNLQERWTTFRQQLLQLEPLSLPRWLGILRCDTARIEIHGFSDASQLAMAAVVYIRIPNGDNTFSVHMVCSKTKVAPLKRLTIPRLELTAALLLSRLIAIVKEALELLEALEFCWSDSEATIKWITAHPSGWKDFVRNRVSAIQEILPNGSWRFVPGTEMWLSESQASWPSTEYRQTLDINMEERPGYVMLAAIDIEAKHPLILPRRSPLTILVIEDAHRRSLHGGTQVTLSLLRETFWIIGGRAPVRSHILRCGRCARYRGIRAKQLMGQLPFVRVNPAWPFSHSGLDYAGPVTLKTWRGRAAKSYKGYLAIFVCLATSAVHIEVVTDYTTDAFIAAYKRFSGRQGICFILWSDCGTNFVRADAELKRLFQQSSLELGDIAALLANDGTEWRFNPSSAPHFGGKLEAAVKSVKFHLKRVLGEKVLTYEEMTTITVQIEAVLNSRPLCPLTDAQWARKLKKWPKY
ncbi:uncharacterized protein [Temnothorax nylanderi]|uniref:uncharacterized protein n=1 Tax=Temnothorax nylanderi TaxID=102681 RepID=UPI003A8983A8